MDCPISKDLSAAGATPHISSIDPDGLHGFNWAIWRHAWKARDWRANRHRRRHTHWFWPRIFRWAATILTSYGGSGFPAVALRPDKRALHDLLAGTKVVAKEVVES